eukprot:3606870-Prymnesium_polylepis.1
MNHIIVSYLGTPKRVVSARQGLFSRALTEPPARSGRSGEVPPPTHASFQGPNLPRTPMPGDVLQLECLCRASAVITAAPASAPAGLSRLCGPRRWHQSRTA